MLLRLILIVFVLKNFSVDCANILWLSGLASPSHQLWSGVIQKALVEKGHNLTSLSVDPEKVRMTNLTVIHMDKVYEFHANATNNFNSFTAIGPFATIRNVAKYRSDACIPILLSSGAAQLKAYPADFKFDLIIHDFVAAKCLLGFVPRFGNPPLISASASTCSIAIALASGNPQFPHIVPGNQLNRGFDMNLMTMIYNFLLYMYDNLLTAYLTIYNQNSLAIEFFGNQDLDVSKISKSSKITLVNLAPYDVMQPFYQTVVPVGGLHIEKPKPLEDSLRRFIDGGRLGVVYFALGTNVKSERFSTQKLKIFLDVFKEYPSHRFLWKIDPHSLDLEVPDNVMVKKWMPQNDILAHPNVKVFIGHGGALSCSEAVWYGVPQIIIPFMIDQKQNAARAVERGIALKLDHSNISKGSVHNALFELLYNSSFKDNVQLYSRAFRDQPQTPLERAIFWIEYVLRNGNNMKLRSPGQDFEMLGNLTLDGFVVLIVILLTQLVIINWWFAKK